MISVSTAVTLIRQNALRLPPVLLPLPKASGLVLAKDVKAPIPIPSFHQSAMDGYAFCFNDYVLQPELLIEGEIAAGDTSPAFLQPFHAVRIFTGAPIPQRADTVVMQEKASNVEGKLIIQDKELTQGRNVRTLGSEIQKDTTALSAGCVITPAATGFLSSLGCTEVNVHPKPMIQLIVTGKELQKPGKPLLHGQVYESNSVMLQAALAQVHINQVGIAFTGDDVEQIQQAIETALHSSQLVILTGGVSVGDYDFVVEAAQKAGVVQIFHKVAQRPGKPLYCGRKGNAMLFGLPGNPASVLSCFYNFVIPAIEAFTGRQHLVEKRRLPLAAAFDKKIALTQFLKAHFDGTYVMPLSAQESFRLSSFAVANCLIALPEEKRVYDKGETVETLVLPYL